MKIGLKVHRLTKIVSQMRPNWVYFSHISSSFIGVAVLRFHFSKRHQPHIGCQQINFSAHLHICMYLLNPIALVGSDTTLISEFSFFLTGCLSKAEEPRLPNYLPRAGGRIIGFIPFPRVLVQCEMQSTSSRI